MATFTNQITDFRRGELGADRLASRSPEQLFTGFMQSDEVMHYGLAITKRPPTKYIAPFPVHDYFAGNCFYPLPNTFTGDTKILLRGANGVFYFLQNGDLLLDETKLLSRVLESKGEGGSVLVKIRQAGITPVLDSGRIYPLFLGNQLMDYGMLKSTTLDPSFYNLVTLGEKTPYPVGDPPEASLRNAYIGLETLNNITFANTTDPVSQKVHLRTPENNETWGVPYTSSPVSRLTNLAYSDYSIFEGKRVFVSQENSFSIDANGNFAAAPTEIGGESITFFENLLISGASENDSAVLRIKQLISQDSGPPSVSSKKIQLLSAYGNGIYWIRGASRGIVFATNLGIFLGIFDTTTADPIFNQIIKITDEKPSRVKPVVHRDFIFHVSANGTSINYIRFERFQANAVTQTLNNISNIIDPQDRVFKMDKVVHQSSVHLLILTEQGRMIVAAVNLGDDGLSASISLSRWLVEYDIYDLIVGIENLNTAYFVGRIKGQSQFMVFSMEFTEQPVFRARKECRPPAIDLYKEIDTNKIFFFNGLFTALDFDPPLNFGIATKPALFFRQIDPVLTESYQVSLRGNLPIFLEKLAGHNISAEVSGVQRLFKITNRIDPNTITAYLINGSTPDLVISGSFVLKEYEIKINFLTTAPYLYYLNVIAGKILIDSNQKVTKYEGHSQTLPLPIPASQFRIGLTYTFAFITTPISTPRIFASQKGLVRIMYEQLCWSTPTVGVTVYDEMGAMLIIPSREWSFLPDEFVKHFVHELQNRNITTSKLQIKFESAGTTPPFITAIGMHLNDAF